MQENTATPSRPRRPLSARLFRWSGLGLLPPWLRRLLALVLWCGYFGFALLVLALRYWVLPNIESYRGDIEQALSRAAGLAVTIARIDTHWQGLRPHLSLNGFRVHDAEGRPALSFDAVETELSWTSLLHGELRLHRLEIHAPELHIRRDREGRIFVAGLRINTAAGGPDLSDWLLAQKRVVVRDAGIRWEDELRGAPPLELRQLNFVLQNDGRRHRFGLTAEPPRALAARLDVRGDFRGDDLDQLDLWRGDAYAELDYADLAVWRTWVDYPLDLPQGSGGLRLWLGFSERRLNAVTADIALRDVQMRLAPELPMLDLAFLSGRLSGRLPPAGFEAGARRLALETRDGIVVAPTDFLARWSPAQDKRPAQGEVSANDMDLEALARLAAHLPLDAGVRRALADYAPRGRVQDLKLGWQGEAGAPAAFSVRARFDGLGLRAQGYFPGFLGLSGSIEGSEKGGTVSLQSRNAALELPAVFADPRLDLAQLAAQARWTRADGRVEVQLQTLSFDNKDAAGTASGSYRSSPDGPGEIDLNARLTRGEGAAVWRYMPLVVNREVRDWLRAAITGGRADDARLRLKGDLKDFPFADGRGGLFQVKAKFAGATLRYAPGWPGIDNIAGDLLFEGKRMLIRGERGSIDGVRVSAVSAEIADLEAAEETIVIGGRAAGPTADFLRFIEASPVAAQIDHFTDGMAATGSGTLALRLTMPLRRIAATKIDGDYQFQRNGLIVDADLPPLSDLNGRLQFTAGSVSMKDARAVLLGAPLTINAATRGDGTVAIAADGTLSIAGLRKNFDHPLLEHLSGSAPWRGSVLVRKRAADVQIETNLRGIASSLPEPFNKSANDVLPLRFERASRVESPRAGAAATAPGVEFDVLRLSLEQALGAQIVRRHGAGGKVSVERGAIGIGRVDLPALPPSGIAVGGSLRSLDVDFWRRLAGGGDAPALPIASVSLRAAEMTAFDRPFNDVVLRAVRQDDAWQAQIGSREVSGDISWKAQERGRLRARLKQLVLNEARPGKTLIDEEPLRELPGLDVVADSLVLRDRKLGRLELQAVNEANAWRIDKLALSSPDGTFQADGAWKGGATQINFKLDVNDIGRMLERLGYADAVKRGTARMEGSAAWNGAPTQIDFATLDGNIAVEAARGQFNKLEPGVGRLLGILSLQSLPRRITLDFRDIFSDGFAFDAISGSARMVRGVMTTRDLSIQGPSAKILMSGEVSLPAETQNLKVRVQPAIGESVAVGAMLANPAAGVVAWLAQKVLRDPLDQIFAFEYAVTGSWSDPKVEKLGRETVARPEAPPQ